MKAYIIQSGHFSKAGNFIGFSAFGERVHIYKKDILRLFTKAGIVYRCQGTYENELITFPFYCMAEHLTFDNTDGTTFTRLTAVEISESKLGIVEHAITDWVADLEHAVSDRAADRISKELERAKKNYRRLDNKYDELHKAYEDREHEMQAMQWNYEYAQSERERLELLCKEHENTIMNLQSDDMISKHVIHKINNLTQDYINKLIV